jgi:hypothetical protein
LSVSNAPSWVTRNNIDYSKTSLDKDAAEGNIDIAVDIQISLADQSKYFHYCSKIISQAGIQNGSEINVSFDPTYEQLIFHSIKIIRNGESINKLQLANIKTVRQETELASFIYNGSMDAILILEDVRKGDIIEYSYTIKGFNPIFKNKFATTLWMNFSLPVYDVYYKLLVPNGRKINIKHLNNVPQPVVSNANNQQVYEWHKTNVEPVRLQDYTPSWYNPYNEILLSEFNTWKEVNDWAMELFPIKKELSTEVKNKIREISVANSSDSSRLKATLKFVQDDIRYMGIEIGKNSHKPADPSKVFAQRYGDCKEKSYLLCCMLKAMNIEAVPVLINTEIKKNLSTLLPSPKSFDHVTVRVKLDNDYYWFDPTIAYQRGSIKNIFYPDYQAGLVLSDSTTTLTPIAFRNINAIDVVENFKVSNMFGDGTLIVTTHYNGMSGDDERSDFNNVSVTELMNKFRKFYGATYEDIKADSLTYTDDDETGTFTTQEYYTLPSFWKLNKKQVKTFSFFPFIINDVLREPKEKDRQMPFSLYYPAKYKEKIIIDLPELWEVTETEVHLKNASYGYNSTFYCLGNHVYVNADYETFKDHTSIEETPAYFKDLSEFDDNANYELTYGKKRTEDSNPKKSDNNIIYVFLAIGLLIAGIVWWSKRT